jgi:hypothetical protein
MKEERKPFAFEQYILNVFCLPLSALRPPPTSYLLPHPSYFLLHPSYFILHLSALFPKPLAGPHWLGCGRNVVSWAICGLEI